MLTSFHGRQRAASINQVPSIIIISLTALLKEGKINLAEEIFVNRQNVVGSRSRRKKQMYPPSQTHTFHKQKTILRQVWEFTFLTKKLEAKRKRIWFFTELQGHLETDLQLSSCISVWLSLGERGKRENWAKECAWSVFTLQSANLLLTFSMAWPLTP